MRKATIFNVLRKGTLANEPEKTSHSPVKIRAASNLPMLGKKISVCRIAQELNRHHSTVYREINRNSYFHEDPFLRGYSHVVANDMAENRRYSLRKLLRNKELTTYVIEKLKACWSPEQISGFLKRRNIQGFYACHETIYRFIYSVQGRERGLYKYLVKGRKNRRHKFSRKPRSSKVLEHHGIAYRPDIIDSRETFGHWEGDLVIYRREFGKSNITSLVERKSRYTIIAKNDDRRPIPVMKRIGQELSKLPKSITKTITFDRGIEFMSYSILQKKLGMDSYFCDPQAPWQKGAVESNNNRIRRFLPRDLDINTVTDADIYDICVIMNSTPRKCLNYKTPQEVMDEYLQRAA